MIDERTKQMVAALLRSEGIDLLDKERAELCLSECVAPTICVLAYQELVEASA